MEAPHPSILTEMAETSYECEVTCAFETSYFRHVLAVDKGVEQGNDRQIDSDISVLFP